MAVTAGDGPFEVAVFVIDLQLRRAVVHAHPQHQALVVRVVGQAVDAEAGAMEQADFAVLIQMLAEKAGGFTDFEYVIDRLLIGAKAGLQELGRRHRGALLGAPQ